MKTKCLCSLFFVSLFFSFACKAQDGKEVVDYYNLKIDELLANWQNAAALSDNGNTNPVYARLFASPVLYGSVVDRAFGYRGRVHDI